MCVWQAADDQVAEEEPEEIRPYLTDLEYLEDQFKLMATVLALNQSEMNIKRAKIGHGGMPGYANPQYIDVYVVA